MSQEIARVTGRKVREAVGETETASGSLLCTAAMGVMIQVHTLPPETNPA